MSNDKVYVGVDMAGVKGPERGWGGTYTMILHHRPAPERRLEHGSLLSLWRLVKKSRFGRE